MSETITESVADGVVTADMVEDYSNVYFDVTRAAGNDDPRVRRFVASTPARDRYGDEILLSAWDIKLFLKNPVMLWAHKYHELPIGRAVKLEITDKALLIDMKFTTPEENPVGDQALRLYDGGYLRAVSVGFRSKASEWIDPNDENEVKRQKKEPDIKPGRRFTKVELLELSAVTVGANPEALMVARSMGLVVPEMPRYFHTVYTPPTRLDIAAISPDEFKQYLVTHKDALQATLREIITPSIDASDVGSASGDDDVGNQNAKAQLVRRAETGKDVLAVSPPSPDAGQRPIVQAHSIVTRQMLDKTDTYLKRLP